ncbi:hypothetical protein WISP_72887 [Willisornis vidua]|uniref:SPX domain-containing protein n=1 Tax=Willisornis vidua TaxID=1566151 RepID=A0ABQ9D7P4_9PASS|nr:hypothetical protein WISP_72887 [Willisornis vidua]
MKFAEHLAAHITPEWRKQYIQYEALKEMLYAAVDQAPSIEESAKSGQEENLAESQHLEKEMMSAFSSPGAIKFASYFSKIMLEFENSLFVQVKSREWKGLVCSAVMLLYHPFIPMTGHTLKII